MDILPTAADTPQSQGALVLGWGWRFGAVVVVGGVMGRSWATGVTARLASAVGVLCVGWSWFPGGLTPGLGGASGLRYGGFWVRPESWGFGLEVGFWFDPAS